MADVGTKAAPEGTDVKNIAVKDASILSLKENHKLFFKGFVTLGSYTHLLGLIPIFYCFQVDDVDNPTYFSLTNSPVADETEITNIPNPSYLMIFYEGN